MAVKWLRFQAFQAGDNIVDVQLTAVMKVDRRTQKEAPVVRGNLLPVMGDIRLDFPVFLIYPRQPVENLPGKVRFRAAQRRPSRL